MYRFLRFSVIRIAIVLLLTVMLVAQDVMSGMMTSLSAAPGLTGMEPARSQEREEVTFRPSADTYVLEDRPSENFGREDDLNVDTEPMAVSFIRFDVSGLGEPVDGATLRLWVTNSTDHIPTLWMSPNVRWSENEIGWNSRPAVDSVIVEGEGESGEETWLEFNVSSLIDGNGSYTIALVPNSTDGMDFNSREAAESQPELVIATSAEEATPIATPGLSGDPEPVLLAGGDIAGCAWDEDEATARILDVQPGIVATLGDNVQVEGTREEFDECFDPTWGRHIGRMQPAPGNHDYYTDDGAPYFEYFGDLAGEAGKGWYAYELAGWQVIVLNSNLDYIDNDEQLEWLGDELESSTAACTIAYWHHPRFSSGARHGNDEDMAPFWELLYAHGAEIVLNGHEHVYERFGPQNPEAEADPEFGIRQITVAPGGAELRNFDDIKPNSEVRNASANGVLRLDLRPDSYSWEFISVEGETFADRGSGECHGAPDIDDEDGGTPVSRFEPGSAVLPHSGQRQETGRMARRVAAWRLCHATRGLVSGLRRNANTGAEPRSAM